MEYSFEEIHKEVSAILEETNRIAKDAFVGTTQVDWKKGEQQSTQIVTQTDRELDQILRERLHNKFPDFGFITEENEQEDYKEYNWIIDPIDGTDNFAHKIPLWGTSVALWQDNQPLYGIISFPMLGETIHAIKDKGIFLNNLPLPDTEHITHSRPTVVYGNTGTIDEVKAGLSKVVEYCAFPYFFRCCTYATSQVALGRIDCSIYIKLSLWDIAAIALFAKEAGISWEYISKAPDISKGNFHESKFSFVTGKENIVKQLSAALKEIV